MTTRTDLHSPTNLVTEDYTYVAAFDTQEGIANKPEVYVTWRNGIYSKVFATNDERGMNQCHHCGARMRYTAVLEHTPTGQYIAVGETCADGRFSMATADFHKLRKAAELDRAGQRIRKLVAEFIEANQDLAWLDTKDYSTFPHALQTNSFVCDIARKLRHYGNLSQAQADAVRKTVAAHKVREETPKVVEETAPVVEGRIIITGTVVSTKWQDSDFGGSLKMLVKDDRNFKVWGTVPSSLDEVGPGVRVSFTGTVTKSDNDESFGFFRRPTKASKVAP